VKKIDLQPILEQSLTPIPDEQRSYIIQMLQENYSESQELVKWFEEKLSCCKEKAFRRRPSSY
jgi:hypothetical protein